MNAPETTSDKEGLKKVWMSNLARERVEGLECSSSFKIFENLIEEEGLTYSAKLEGRTRASVYEEIDFFSLEERCLKFVL